MVVLAYKLLIDKLLIGSVSVQICEIKTQNVELLFKNIEDDMTRGLNGLDVAFKTTKLWLIYLNEKEEKEQ